MEFERITIGGHTYFKSENDIFSAIFHEPAEIDYFPSTWEPCEIVGEYINNQPIFNKVYEFINNGQLYYVGIYGSHIIYESKNKQPGSILGNMVDGQLGVGIS